MEYNKFIPVYPCRPKNAAPINDIGKYDNGMMLAQPKFNGSNCSIYSNNEELHILNRHNERIANFKIEMEEIQHLFRFTGDNWTQINGEYLNKAKLDENGEEFNNKLIIFDSIIFDSDHLIGKSFEYRINLLYDFYGKTECEKDYLYKVSDNIYLTKTYDKNFIELYEKFSDIDLIEGLVLKRKRAKLEYGTTENNNHKSQIKFRKPTKNYQF